MSSFGWLHRLAPHGRFAIHERDRNTFRNHEQCFEIREGVVRTTTAYWLRRRCDYFIRHLDGAKSPAYRIFEITPDREAVTEPLEV